MNTLELEKTITFNNVLVATDFSEVSAHALHTAAAIAEGNDAELFLLNVVPPEPHIPVPLDPLPLDLDSPYQQAIHGLEKLAETEPLAHVRHQQIIERGHIGDVVEEVVQQREIDLLVVGTHGRTGIRKIVLGSVAEELFRRASCPVLTVGPWATLGRKIQRVLFATDFGPSSEHALPYAMGFANKVGGELILLHLVSPIPVNYVGPGWFPDDGMVQKEEASKQEFMKKLRNLVPAEAGLSCKVKHVVELHFAAEGIIQAARQHEADLVVMGVRESGRSAAQIASHMPWAVAYEVVCYANCPVMTIRS